MNRICNRNLHSIQDMMRSDKPAGTKFKRVCASFPNLALVPKSATPGNIQVTFDHASVGDHSLRETVTAFTLAGSLESLTAVYVDAECASASAINNICLSVKEVLLCAAVGNLARSKKLRGWVSLNAILLPPFLTEAVILYGKTSTTELLKTFAANTMKGRSEAAAKTPYIEDKYKYQSVEDV